MSKHTFEQLAEQGIVYDMPDQVYHSIKAISASGMRKVWENAEAYKYELDTPKEPTEAMVLGTLTHMLVLEPDRRDFAVWQGARRGKAWEQFCEENADTLVVVQKQYDDAKGMSDSVHSYLPAGEMSDVLDGQHEVSLFWYEDVVLESGEEVRVPCKARLDVLDAERFHAADFKTTRSAAATDFPWDIRGRYGRHGYATQAWWYVRGCERVISEGPWIFSFLACDSSAPYSPKVYRVDPDYLRDEVQDKGWLAVRKFAQCLHDDVWPGHGTSVEWIA